MKATMLYGPRDIRFEERAEPKIINPTDAIIRIAATCCNWGERPTRLDGGRRQMKAKVFWPRFEGTQMSTSSRF